MSPIRISHLGLFLLLTSIFSSFLQLMIKPSFPLSFTTMSMNYFSFLFVSGISTDSSMYLILLILCSAIINHGRTSISLTSALQYCSLSYAPGIKIFKKMKKKQNKKRIPTLCNIDPPYDSKWWTVFVTNNKLI